MKIDKKYLIAGAIGLVTITGAFAYLQYRRLMNYVIKIKKIVINKITLNNVDLNLFLNFTNNSDIGFTIESQSYDVYINDKFVSKIENKLPNKIEPKSTSVIGVNVNFNPSKIGDVLGKNLMDLLTTPQNLRLKVDIKLKVKLWMFKINIPYVYEATFKELMNMKK